MKFLRRRLLKALMAAAFTATAVPSWACFRSCDTASPSLACVKLCTHSKALLTDGGRVPALGADRCGVAVVDSAPTVTASEFQLRAPSQLALAPVAPVVLPALPLLAAAPSARGPPAASSRLSYDHPFANGPPTLL